MNLERAIVANTTIIVSVVVAAINFGKLTPRRKITTGLGRQRPIPGLRPLTHWATSGSSVLASAVLGSLPAIPFPSSTFRKRNTLLSWPRPRL
eukprot:8685167-Lingulodinium_polyedra.AAC.1